MVIDAIDLYSFCKFYRALPSQVLAEDPEIMEAFRILRKAEQSRPE